MITCDCKKSEILRSVNFEWIITGRGTDVNEMSPNSTNAHLDSALLHLGVRLTHIPSTTNGERHLDSASLHLGVRLTHMPSTTNGERHLDSASLHLGVRLTFPFPNSTNTTSIPLCSISVFV